MVKTNVENLVRTCVLGEVRPHLARAGYQITHDGRPVAVPSVGGVCYNVKVGDRLWDWVADHLEPGVSTRNRDREDNVGYNLYSCVGNRARVVSGDAKGAATLLMVEKLEDIVARQVEAIKNLKIDKVTVWDSAGAGGQGTSTANFVSGLIGSLPPLHDVAKMAGVDLPGYLGEMTEGKAEAKAKKK